MTCDGKNSDQLPAGDVWVWPYATSDDVSGLSDPVIEFRDGDVLLASSVAGGAAVAARRRTVVVAVTQANPATMP